MKQPNNTKRYIIRSCLAAGVMGALFVGLLKAYPSFEIQPYLDQNEKYQADFSWIKEHAEYPEEIPPAWDRDKAAIEDLTDDCDSALETWYWACEDAAYAQFLIDDDYPAYCDASAACFEDYCLNPCSHIVPLHE